MQDRALAMYLTYAKLGGVCYALAAFASASALPAFGQPRALLLGSSRLDVHEL